MQTCDTSTSLPLFGTTPVVLCSFNLGCVCVCVQLYAGFFSYLGRASFLCTLAHSESYRVTVHCIKEWCSENKY